MKEETVWRGGFYLAGTLSLSFGITLSTRAGLGVSPITSFAYAAAQGMGYTLGLMVFLEYALMVFIEFLLDGKKHRKWSNLLQLPFGVVFGSFLDAFAKLVQIQCGTLWEKWALLCASLVFIGFGGAMMVAMRVVTNPSDALYMAMARFFRKDPGLMKNVLDLLCVLGAAAFDLALTGRISSVGLGTVATMLLTGRLVYVFNRLCRRRVMRLAGLSE